MPNNTNTTNNNYSSNQNVSDKHLAYFNNRNPEINPSQPVNTPNLRQALPNQQTFGNPVPQNVQAQATPSQNTNQPNLVQQPKPYFPANQLPNTPVAQKPIQSPPQVQNQSVLRPVQNPTQPVPQQINEAVNQPPQIQRPQMQIPANPQNQPNPQLKYLNPENITQNLPPKNMDELRVRAIQANKQLPDLPKNITNQHYDPLVPQTKQITINTFELLKLCIYIIPGLPIFMVIFKSIKDEEVMWNSRQSLVMQVMWLTVYFLLQNINLPLISGSGITLANIWNLLCIGVLVYTGSQAYVGKHYRIPVVSDIGTTFIDGK